MNPAQEIERRRTFAIVSHPDAGKTTLTEKLLLFGGAIQLAGTVKGRKAARHATSDWMRLEQQRGISVTSSVMQFPYGGCVVNLLDTPGHEDFSEDTYRTLTAVDSALMVIDCAKGVEERTIKLMEVCRLRDTPIMTFINKLDREGRPPIELLDEIERVLGIATAPVTWPIGMGRDLKGIYHLAEDRIYVYEAGERGRVGENQIIDGLHSEAGRALLGDAAARFDNEIELVRGAAQAYDMQAYLAGRQTPVFFGSAISNFGVEELLKAFTTFAPGPQPRATRQRSVEATEPKLSGFVFKIQANMNPKHRDRIAFVRIVSGQFKRDMDVINGRSGERVRLANSQRLFARERETVDDAFAGDVVGLVGNYDLLIGDTLSSQAGVTFDEIPRFAPECFSYLHNKSTAKYKRFRDGLQQLLKEGVASEFVLIDTDGPQIPLLGAVGPLQFEVLQYRLEGEYAAETRIEQANWSLARWLRPKEGDPLAPDARPSLSLGAALARDSNGWLVALLPSEWALKTFSDKNEEWIISEQPFPPLSSR